MSERRVMCCDSPIFLKRRFGAGYHLRIYKRLNFIERNSSESSTAVFPNLFDDKEKLGIASCEITVTTMEDVFLSVGHDSEDNGDEINGDHKKLKEKSSETLLINTLKSHR
jgi:hypothetical protein